MRGKDEKTAIEQEKECMCGCVGMGVAVSEHASEWVSKRGRKC